MTLISNVKVGGDVVQYRLTKAGYSTIIFTIYVKVLYGKDCKEKRYDCVMDLTSTTVNLVL